MNRQVRRVALFMLVMFGLIFSRLVWVQIVKAEELAQHPRNTRLLLAEYSIERGAILASDGVTLAQSQATPDAELNYLRTYPTAHLFAHVTGYYSVRFGRTGMERSYNKALTGKGGVLTMQDLGDRLLGRGERGDDVVLSIDSRVQQAAAAALGDRKGAVVALDPLSGQVLALHSSPSFDPNPLSQHSAKGQEDALAALQNDANNPDLNRALNQSYPPGSTFKVITAAAALLSGRGSETSFPASREYIPPQTDKPIRNFGGGTCGGDMPSAFRVSCNTYFAQLGAEVSAEDLAEAAQAFGFGEVPPIDIRGSASRLPSEDALRSPAFRAQSAIGQFEVSATPLQMALVAAGIAGDGKVPVPRLMKEVRDSRGARLDESKPEVWKEALPPEIAQTIKSFMVAAVQSGTGTRAAISGVTVGGKTGTAQTGRGDASHSWFIGFAPAESPRIAVAVIVEAREGGDEETGGRIAAPIAKAVMEAHRSVAAW